MKGFDLLDLDIMLAIHEEQLAHHGGGAGIRDIGLLQSALAKPLNMLSYNPDADIAALAASYAFGIVRNHPFIDGNKRTAYVAMELFLALNDATLLASDEDSLLAMLALAAGDMGEAEYAAWIRSRLG